MIAENPGMEEAVVPMQGGSIPVRFSGGGGKQQPTNVTVKIIDQRAEGGQIETREQRDGSGYQRSIEIMIKDAVNKLGTQGDLDRMLAANFGVARRGMR